MDQRATLTLGILCIFACTSSDPITNSQTIPTTPSQEIETEPTIAVDTSVVDSVQITGDKVIEIKFKEEMDPTSTNNALDYEVDPFIKIVDAKLSTDRMLVVLKTERILPNKELTLHAKRWLTLSGKYIKEYQTKMKSRNLVAFISDSIGTGNFSTWAYANSKTGIEAAHEVCSFEAQKNGFIGEFAAWISDSQHDAKEYFVNSNGGRYSLRYDGHPWIQNLNAISQKQILVPLNSSSSGQSASSARVFSSTDFQGNKSGYGGGTTDAAFCNDWTSDSSSFSQTLRNASRAGSFWMDDASSSQGDCSYMARLYCIELGQTDDIALPTTNHKKVFVTSVRGKGNLMNWPDAVGATSGIDAGDKICQKRASIAGVPNASNFKAWLNSSTASASSRYTTNAGLKYYSVFHSIVSNNFNGFFPMNTPEVGPIWDEYGQAILADTPYVHVGGFIASQMCSDWTSDVGMASKYSVGLGTVQSVASSCGDVLPLLCIQD